MINQNKIHNIFPTTILESNIGINKKLINFLKKEDYEFIYENNIKNGFVTKNKYILENEIYSDLKKKILEKTKNYLFDIFSIKKNINFIITNSWCVKHEKNDKSPNHNHDNSILSGVYYFQTPKNCGNIIFERNRYLNNLFSSTLSFDLEKLNNFNNYYHTINVYEGLLILFPSHLLHFTEANNSNDLRYSLSFNVFFNGIIGSDNNLNLLKIN